MRNSRVFIGLVLTVLLSAGCIQKTSKIENLQAFAKAFGYVRYFHPSDEAQEIDWSKFSAFGAQEIEKCTSSQQVVETLTRLFKPIAPSVRFTNSKDQTGYDLKIITPENPAGFRLTYWQHEGVGTGMQTKQLYKSVRANSSFNSKQDKLFDYQPESGKIITKQIGEEIFCEIPLVLYRNDQQTYPKADSLLLGKLKKALGNFNSEPDQLSFRTGNVINVYNVFQHFYPYFDVVEVNWDNELAKALTRSFTDETQDDHLITLRKFTASLKDGHISIMHPLLRRAVAPVRWEWIENKLVITQISRNNPDIHIGDIVTQINGISSEKYFAEIKSQISAGTSGLLNKKAELLSLEGDRGSALHLTINDQQIDLVRDYSQPGLMKAEKRYMQIDDSIWYLNMDMIGMDTINFLMPALEKCKAIICDARGYPKGNHEFITHLMKSDDTTKSWMQVPRIIYPDHENIAGYIKFNWLLKAQKPYLGDKKIVYIIDGGAISYAESCLGYIEGYNLATIVGQPSAGTNGNVNPFKLPGGYTVSWTGMKVLKHNGTQHHGIGILPDVYVTKTIQGIKEGRDEFLEKAIEMAKTNFTN